MIDLKDCIRYCIENFTVEEATERLYKFMNESLELKEKEIELINSIKIPEVLKEPNFEYLKNNIESIYRHEYNPCEGKHFIYVDPKYLTKNDSEIIHRFKSKNDNYVFVYQTNNNPYRF